MSSIRAGGPTSNPERLRRAIDTLRSEMGREIERLRAENAALKTSLAALRAELDGLELTDGDVTVVIDLIGGNANG